MIFFCKSFEKSGPLSVRLLVLAILQYVPILNMVYRCELESQCRFFERLVMMMCGYRDKQKDHKAKVDFRSLRWNGFGK